MKILFLDDEEIRYEVIKTRFPKEIEIVYAQTLESCARHLENHANGIDFFDIIHFDHDLKDPKTNLWYSSWQLAESFVNVCPPERKPKMVVIHSVNPQGSWALYHIFCKLTKSFMCPFRLENSKEYEIAIEYQKEKELNVKL